MKVVILAAFLCSSFVAAAVVEGKQQEQPPPTFAEPWLDIFSEAIKSVFMAKIQKTTNFRASNLHGNRAADEFPDPWQFSNTTHDMTWLFREGEVNTYNPRVVGLSNIAEEHFTLDLSTNRVQYSVRFPTVSWYGHYDLWIDYHSIISPYPYERRRGNGEYRHHFHNVQFVATFELHTHPSGRINVVNLSSNLAFEKCDVWSENYTINSRPIGDWIGVSREWKEKFDTRWEQSETVVEEALEFFYGVAFSWPYQLTRDEIIQVFQYWGADIIETN